ncbi:MAG: hypothetical protein QOJ52_3316 [Acidimicrobiaceae bacterium]|jgi:hypothetical protein|nr:hypothetical protein [Acidimicrobiaceae bacterium]MDQ1364061.1 hypothetical protein [Acidimicrobiaceae bacterium]MDQ1400874.1 hypothetical protein [Acidimicrobiaceae bacterium]MDQ1412933.1 hypothetical protein [Acidimicrobiaceae bacterium]MDQ1414429.1 hypothetical protein [Acidimicrobiaceae bacterium]
MKSFRLRRTVGKVAGAGLVAAVALGMTATPAFADTSTATANAATLSIGGATALTTGLCTSSNPGSGANNTCNQTPNLTLLGTQTAITAGLLVQQTVARADGTSAACAGLVGPGGTIQIGTAGQCTVSGAAPGGVQLNLGLATVHADAILAECTASSTGGTTRSVQLVNATVALLGGGTTPIISSPPANDTAINLGALVTATFNKQPATSPAPPAGSVSTSALDVAVLSGLPGVPPLIHLTVGTVSCGPNAVTPLTPVIPAAGAPIAIGMLLISGFIGWRFWWVPRQAGTVEA